MFGHDHRDLASTLDSMHSEARKRANFDSTEAKRTMGAIFAFRGGSRAG